jgi:hypothetical protein
LYPPGSAFIVLAVSSPEPAGRKLARPAARATVMMSEVHNSVPSPAEALARRVRNLLESLPIAGEFLKGWPDLEASRPTVPRLLPVVAHLNGLVARSTPALSPLVQALADAADVLEWRQTYAAADFGPAFLERYGWTELIGQRGPIPSTHIACGFLMLGPDTDYPSHAHEAEELYLPLAGAALWMRAAEGFVSRPAGLPIYHPSWMPHAMRTGAEPLLALYVWRAGDLAAKSRIMGQAGA